MSRSVDPLVVGRVIGDVIDMFTPSVDMAVLYTSRQVKNGCQMKPSAAAEAPWIRVTDRDDGGADSLFTLIMTDPDAPSPSEPTLREWVHWIVTDIPGQSLLASSGKKSRTELVIKESMAGQGSSKRAREPVSSSRNFNVERHKKGPAASTTSEREEGTSTETESSSAEMQEVKAMGNEVVPYNGPSPPIGIHRYIFVLFKQPSEEQPMLVMAPPYRNNFNTRNFALQHGLGLPVAATYFNAAKEPGTRRR